MVCKKCGAESPDNAVFCGTCGARLDGKKPCSSCKQLNDENSAYCVFCGARIDGKRVCARCGTAYEGKFCPSCGYGEKDNNTVKPMTAVGETKGSAKAWTWKKIVRFSASCLGMLGVLFALIFTFCIGVVGKVGSQAVTTSKSTLGMARNMFYFFGNFFKDAEALSLNDTFEGSIRSVTVYTYGVLGLLISLTTIVLVITFASMAITKFVKGLMDKKTVFNDKWSILTMGSFFFGAGAFYGLHRFVASASEDGVVDVSLSIEIGLKGGVIAGIVLCAIFLGLMVLGKLVVKGKELLKTKTLIKLGLSVVGVVFVTLTFLFVRNSGIFLSIVEDGVEIKAGMTSSFLNMGIDYLIGLVSCATEDNEIALIESAEKAVLCGNLAQIVFVFTLLFAVFALCAKLTATTNENASSGMYWSIAVFVSLIVGLILALISVNALENVYELSLSAVEESVGGSVDLGTLTEVFQCKTTGIIGALVCSVLLLGVSIAQSVIQNIELTQKYYKALQQKR
ncbi:MAG: zinc ribbon domain-containing protein [Clostridiales bacterium]|nr:zinc ribbon domain-containing protein [Clostridiales bacterium]